MFYLNSIVSKEEKLSVLETLLTSAGRASDIQYWCIHRFVIKK